MNLNFKFNKRRHFVIFVGQQKSGHSFLGQKEFEPGDDKVDFKNRDYPISIENPTYTKGLKSYYFYNIESSTQLQFGDVDPSIKPRLMDMIVSKSIVSQLSEDLTNETNYLEVAMYLLVGFLFGGMLGFIIAQFLIGGGI